MIERDWFRQCRFCKHSDYVYRDGQYNMVHYSTRSYAHFACLVARKGVEFAEASTPRWKLEKVVRAPFTVEGGPARVTP